MEPNIKVPLIREVRDKLKRDIIQYAIEKGVIDTEGIAKWIEVYFGFEFIDLSFDYGYTVWDYYVDPIRITLKIMGLCD